MELGGGANERFQQQRSCDSVPQAGHGVDVLLKIYAKCIVGPVKTSSGTPNRASSPANTSHTGRVVARATRPTPAHNAAGSAV